MALPADAAIFRTCEPVQGDLLSPVSDDDLRIATIAATMADNRFPTSDIGFILSLMTGPSIRFQH